VAMWMTRFSIRLRTFQGPSCFDVDSCRTRWLFTPRRSRWPSMAELAARYLLSVFVDLICISGAW
jgi:hypothetical protein